MVSYSGCYAVVLFLTLISVILVDRSSRFLRDRTRSGQKAFDLSKVQLAFWFIIIISSIITVVLYGKDHQLPTLSNANLLLLGLTTGTFIARRLTAVAHQQNLAAGVNPDLAGASLISAMLSDVNGIELHKLQYFIANLLTGSRVIYEILSKPNAGATMGFNQILPDISPVNLILLAVSSGTFLAVKAKTANAPAISSQPATNADSVYCNDIIPFGLSQTVTATTFKPRNIFVKVQSAVNDF